jgi:tRNA modification GTPase
MLHLADTIVAPITGQGPAPVAVVRLSGAGAWEIARAVFSPLPAELRPRFAHFGKVAGVDEGFLILFEAGRSYTGERSAEISLHGSAPSVRRLLQAGIAAGARMATPGEFTLRAFMNGRIDLTQAEGIRDAVAARTDAQLRQASLHREGSLREKVNALRDEITSLLAAVEASIDFSEEVGELDRDAATTRISSAIAQVETHSQAARAGRLLRQGIRVVIAGRPNAGKSSLFNAALGCARAIVTDVPGTTRDYVEEQVERGGLLWVLTDTAGLRSTEDAAERIGVNLARGQMEAADAVWYVVDAQVGLSEDERTEIASIQTPTLVLANKSDLAPGATFGLAVCALSGEGIPEAFDLTASMLCLEGIAERPLPNARQAPLLERAGDGLRTALQALSDSVPDDLAAVGLRAALDALGEITGERATDDMLERIFADFCVGK